MQQPERRTGIAARILGRWRGAHDAALSPAPSPSRTQRTEAARARAPRPAPVRRPIAATPPPEPRPVARVGLVSVVPDADGLGRLHDVLARTDVPRCVIVELHGAPPDTAAVRTTLSTAPTRVVVVVDDHQTRAALAGVPGIETTTSRTAAMQLASRSALVSYRTLAA